MRVHHLNCASMYPPLAGRIVCHVLLCESEAGLVLVDTGFGLRDIADPARRIGSARRLLRPALDPDETASRQVAALGHSPSDVTHIVLTHFDLDHVGGLADFPRATVHAFDREYAAATRPTLRERSRYRPVMWEHQPKIVTYPADGEPWHGFAAARPLDGLGDDFALVPLIGHTRGHSLVAVDAGERGWLLHAGDAFFDRSSVARPSDPQADQRRNRTLLAFERAMAYDVRRISRNHEVLRGLRDSMTVFSAHDPVLFDRLAAATG